MPVHWLCSVLPLLDSDVTSLWKATLRRVRKDETIAQLRKDDREITIRCVSKAEIQRLNNQYRHRDTPTNVLTFSYDEGVCDIAICDEVAQQESERQHVTLRDYSALLVVHAFLHSIGLDHERSETEALATMKAQADILQAQGFTPVSLVPHA